MLNQISSFGPRQALTFLINFFLVYFTLYWKFETYIPKTETAQPRSQFLHSCIWEWFPVYIPMIGLICNFNFPTLHERTLSSTAEVARRLGNCRQAVVDGSSLLSHRSCGWAESSHNWQHTKFPIWKIMNLKWKQLIIVVKFLIWFESEWGFKLRHLY